MATTATHKHLHRVRLHDVAVGEKPDLIAVAGSIVLSHVTQAGEARAYLSRQRIGRGVLVEILLDDGPTRHAQEASISLWAAAHNNDVEGLHALLTGDRADPCAGNSAALVAASNRRHAAAVRLLLADGRSDPGRAATAAASDPRRERDETQFLVQAAAWWRRRRLWVRLGGVTGTRRVCDWRRRTVPNHSRHAG
jgi:hypothetical protein